MEFLYILNRVVSTGPDRARRTAGYYGSGIAIRLFNEAIFHA